MKAYKPRRLEYSKRKVESGIALVNQSEICMSQFQQKTNILRGMNECELFVWYIFIPRCVRTDLRFVRKNYTTGFSAKKFYTPKETA